MNFYVSITTIKKYKPALDVLIESLPLEWRNKYILVYQNENENYFNIFEDGHIEVYITNNLSDYGKFCWYKYVIRRKYYSSKFMVFIYT
jgi:hypothetical protein